MNVIAQGAQTILNRSTLELSLFKITNANKDSFALSMEVKVQNIGRFSATLSSMTVDMVGPAGTFGRLELPQVKVKNGAADVAISDQVIKIVDTENFEAFLKALTQDEELVMRFENGKGTIRVMLMSINVTYEKELRLKGTNGPKTTITKTERDEAGSVIDVRVLKEDLCV